MMSFEKNPYSWKEGNITGTVGSVSLTTVNGTVIAVENLPEEIEVILYKRHSHLLHFGWHWLHYVFSVVSDSPASA